MNFEKIRKVLSDEEHDFPFEIRIECEVHDSCDISDLKELQGDLKERKEEDVIKILKSIRDYGFSVPFFYWQGQDSKYIMDGHGRKLALDIFRQLNGNVPQLPIFEIKAKDKKEAKQKLLRLDSRYGKVTKGGFDEFVADLDVNFDELSFNEININIEKEDDQEGVEYKQKLELIIECDDISDLEQLYDEMSGRGMKCKLSTL